VCGTDVHLHHGQLAGVPYPIIPGHVSVGRIAHLAGEMMDVEGNFSVDRQLTNRGAWDGEV